MSDNIFEPKYNGMPRSEMYRAQVAPDLFPHEKPMLIHQWSEEDRVMWCGGEYTPGYEFRHFRQRYVKGAE